MAGKAVEPPGSPKHPSVSPRGAGARPGAKLADGSGGQSWLDSPTAFAYHPKNGGKGCVASWRAEI